MRYKISTHIRFISPDQEVNNEERNNASETRISIHHIQNGRTFLINSSIKNFIEKFCLPKTFTEVTESIATEINACVDKVNKSIKPFFNYCKYRGFIVPEKHEEKTLNAAPILNSSAIFHQYKIENNIAVNEDIDVYLATDISSEKAVIIKLLKSGNKKEIDELKREYNFLKTLNEANTSPQAFSFIEEKKYAFFTQEYLDGLSLPQFIKRKKRVAKKKILLIAEEILKAFANIHTKDIVHGDIHPSNIMLTEDNRIKVLDFGLAIHQETEKDEIVNFGGAYFFMPPERINKTTYKKFTRKPDFRSDVFQLGIVFYMLLYDVYPFNGITWEDLATEIKEKEIEFPAKACYGFAVSEKIKATIRKCVSKKPEERFKNALELYIFFIKNKASHAGKIRSAVKI